MKRCIACQAEQDNNNRFCTRCGGSAFEPCVQQKVIPEKPRKKAKWLIPVLAVLALAAAGAAAVLLLFDPVEQFEDHIRGGNYGEAAKVLEEHIEDDRERSRQAEEALRVYLEERYGLYCENTITYDELTMELDSISELGMLSSRITTIRREASNREVLREIYAKAEAAFAEEDYASAIWLYSQVAGADFENGEAAETGYSRSVDAYRDVMIEQARSYMESDSYELALMVLEEAMGVLPQDQKLMDAYADCSQAWYDYDVDQLIAAVDVYMESHDYVGALGYLDECVYGYPDELRLAEKREQCLAEFESYVITESVALAEAGDYRHARSLAESGLKYFSSTDVTELIQVYTSHIPVLLCDMEIFQNNSEGGSWVTQTDSTNTYLEDNYGNVYESSLSVDCGSLTYLVNFRYQTFRGTVAFPKGKESDGYRESASLYIYGDDELIASFLDVNDGSRPESFELDISGYERLTLKWECKGMNIWSDWGFFATIFDGELTPIPLEMPALD